MSSCALRRRSEALVVILSPCQIVTLSASEESAVPPQGKLREGSPYYPPLLGSFWVRFFELLLIIKDMLGSFPPA